MKLYQVVFDGQPYHVEAKSMGEAVRIWLAAMKPRWGKDWTGDEEPEQVVLIGDHPVIREQKPTAASVPGSLRSAAQAVIDAYMQDGDLADALEDPDGDDPICDAVAALRDVLGTETTGAAEGASL